MDYSDYGVGYIGNGRTRHLTDDKGALCNRWGSTNGQWKAPKSADGEANCKRCLKIAKQS